MDKYAYQPNDDGSVTLFIEGGDPRGHTFDPDDFPNLEPSPDAERDEAGFIKANPVPADVDPDDIPF